MSWTSLVGSAIGAAGKAGTPMPAGPSISSAAQNNDGWTVSTGSSRAAGSGESGGLPGWAWLAFGVLAGVAVQRWMK
jgi:hypothetical protein